MIEHRRALCETNRVLFAGRKAVDAGCQVNIFRLPGDHPHDDLGRGHVAVLRETVVFPEPGVLPVVPVSEDGVLGLAHQLAMLPVAVVRTRTGDIAVEKQSELHRAPPWSRLEAS